MNLAKKNIKKSHINIVLCVLSFLLLVGLLFVVKISLNIVSETSKNNLVYASKVRDTIEEIDKIVERAQVNLDVFSKYTSLSYNSNKLYDQDYNMEYLKTIDLLTNSILANSPGVDGAWFQVNVNVPFSNLAYSWYEFKNGKSVNLREQFTPSVNERKLNSKDDPYYFEAVKKKGTIWSKIYKDVDINQSMITIAEPIYKNNVLIGVAGIDISVNELEQVMGNMQKIFKGSEIFLLNENGNIILAKTENNHLVKNSYNFSSLLDERNKDKLIEYFNQGKSKTAILLELSNDYHLVITFPNLVIYKGFNQLFRTIYFIFGVLVVLTIALIINQNKISEANKNLAKERNTLRTIIDSSPNVVIIKDLNGKILECNTKFCEVTKRKREELLGKSENDLFDAEKIKEIQENTNVVKEFQKELSHETWYYSAINGLVYVEEHIIPLFDSSNILIGFIIIAFNITKQKQIQEDLQKAKDELEKTNLFQRHLLENIKYEIKIALNKILTIIDRHKDIKETKEQKKMLDKIQRESHSIINTIDNLIILTEI